MSQHPIEVTDTQFATTVLGSQLPVLVDFWAPWCGPCRMIAPVLEELAGELAGRLTIAKVNTDESSQYAQKLGIQGIPTMIVFSGGREVERIVGALPKAALRSKLQNVLANLESEVRA